MTSVTVYHNKTSQFMPYTEGDQLVPVVGYTTPETDVNTILGHAFRDFNVGESNHSPVIREYREVKRARSLSVGDVVEVDGVKYACERTGWKKLEKQS